MKYTDRIMSVVTDALSRMDQITSQIKELDCRHKAEEISGVDYQAQKAGLLKQRDAIRHTLFLSARERTRPHVFLLR